MIEEALIASDQRHHGDLSRISKVFSVSVSLEAIFYITLTLLQRYVDHMPFDDHYKLSLVICLAVLFLAYFAIDGVLTENKFELVCFLAVVILTTFYSLYNFITRQDRTTVTWVRFWILMVMNPLNLVLGWLAYKSFGWKIYRKIGANIEMIHMYRTYQIFLAFLKMDLNFALTIVFGVGMSVLTSDHLEFYMDLGFFIVTLGWAVLGWYAIRHELPGLAAFFFFVALVEPAYIMWKLVQYLIIDKEVKYTTYSVPVLIVCAMALVCRVVLVAWAGWAVRHFHRGLRTVFEKEETTHHHKVPIFSG